MAPTGLLFDYGGTLIEEVSVNLRAGTEWVLSCASYRPAHATLENVLERASRITNEVAGRRDHVHLETPWPTLTRLIHDFFGMRFDIPMSELEMGFWKASVETRPMPGAVSALEQFHRLNVPMGVVCNTSFGEPVIRYELARHGLADHLAFSWSQPIIPSESRTCCCSRRPPQGLEFSRERSGSWGIDSTRTSPARRLLA